ncbi:MAG: cytochrome c biogenesis protein CcsA [Flavobacteriales bacterium]|nr:cytochrome c biogenesis protein CcsA [Flavobacteriales bacterium]MCW8913506.1 cytochrome c biogenesis protein CcsA [Flavobacteriales bacterium]MCW8937339.1 cytochrome c biogenesis protein CcsA [Flavobacteriales bacterium]MCW8940013.1 cytochrome c biogenesis protein CcsA [Flavobacteriales bacterium]MCW8968168.1 cytochrome c biogenesis protein CcsA [Flavobacteriales bacterium]
MFEQIKNILFSTKLTAVLLFIFAFAIGLATFIENDYGTPASKAIIFNTKWFEILMVLMAINFSGNIFKYKLYRKEKLAILMFHLAFIIVIIGAGITRYISYEGSMHIREGEMSDKIVSADTYFQFKVDDEKMQYTFDKLLFLNPRYNEKFSHSFTFEGKEIEVKYKDYIPNSIDTVIPTENGKTILEIVTTGQSGRVSQYVENGKIVYFGGIPVSYNHNKFDETIQINDTDSGITIKSPYDITYLSMDDQTTGMLDANETHFFTQRKLYTVNNVQLVFKETHQNSKIEKISTDKNNKNGEDALVVDVISGNNSREVTLFGGRGYVSPKTIFQLNGLNFSLAYGSKHFYTPFKIKLNDFTLERYPGSNSPSSYESNVTLYDERNEGFEHTQRIYMNNVLDYDGYRFFQSSYDNDELGTVLSVNHDFWGTTVTYIGYFFLFLGMILTLFSKKSRFLTLRKSIDKLKKQRVANLLLIAAFLSIPNTALKAQHNHDSHQHSEETVMDASHAKKFGKIIIQSPDGRLKPINTWASEVLRKVARKDKLNGQTPEQVLLGMLYNPRHWQEQPMIYINRNIEQLQKELNAKNNYATFFDFFDHDFNYVLSEQVKEATRKKPGERSKYDDEVIKVDERINICYMVYEGSLLRLFPKHKDPNDTWYSFLDYKKFETHDSIFVKSFLPLYFNAIHQSLDENDWQIADSTLKYLDDYQKKFGASVYPSETEINVEVAYNKINIFNLLFKHYAIIGILMLIFLFMDIFNPKKWKTTAINALSIILFVHFIAHTGGLAARWYISGHAPWSNGYESMIFIAWATLLAGFIFSKANKMSLASTAVLAFVILFVANLNWLDPEITPLVPVLKSYWLMIHVAIMTGSYGFLALGALLGFLNLLLMIFKTNNNKNRIDNTIKQITYTIEMTLIVGVFMAAIGTFLGGIWANESWGRYWGWDPKETWALVIVMYYAMLLHLRLIPGANGKYLFNLLAVLGIGVVIMTYFGVNYYLSGLHSYAAGDSMPFPTSLKYLIVIVVTTAIAAYFKNRHNKIKKI